jgi:hypothetical protein
MAREEFNREMGDYLRRRNVIRRADPIKAARDFFSKAFTFESRAKKEEPPLDIPPEQVEAVLAQDAIQQNTSKRTVAKKPQVVSIPQEIKKQETKTMGWLFGKKKEQEEDYDTMEAPTVTQPVIDEDVKEVLKITFKWLKQMDPEQVEEIKNSSDFEKYKAVLGKYGLIKK